MSPLSSNKILIYGAGAIGRGFLGPLLKRCGVGLSFVDIDKSLIAEMKKRKTYKAAITKDDGYEIVDIPINEAFLLGEEGDIKDYDLIFCCVGPNNCYDLAEKLKEARAVISCENDASSSIRLRELSGNPNIYFGIPDVITSNTASAELKNLDSLMTVTEQGILVLEKGNYSISKKIIQLDNDELKMHWMCKLFIHNAPHAITAYLGWLKGYTYIHEAMADPDVEEVVLGSICEMTDGVVLAGFATREFATMYKEKEIRRFKNNYLYDTIARVAREPLRKLNRDNRIILGLRLAMFNSSLPKNTSIGAKAALAYDNPNDKEAVYMQSLIKNFGEIEIFRRYAGIEAFDPLGNYVISQDISKFRKGV